MRPLAPPQLFPLGLSQFKDTKPKGACIVTRAERKTRSYAKSDPAT